MRFHAAVSVAELHGLGMGWSAGPGTCGMGCLPRAEPHAATSLHLLCPVNSLPGAADQLSACRPACPPACPSACLARLPALPARLPCPPADRVDAQSRAGLLPDSCYHRSVARGGALKRTKYFFGARSAAAAACLPPPCRHCLGVLQVLRAASCALLLPPWPAHQAFVLAWRVFSVH